MNFYSKETSIIYVLNSSRGGNLCSTRTRLFRWKSCWTREIPLNIALTKPTHNAISLFIINAIPTLFSLCLEDLYLHFFRKSVTQECVTSILNKNMGKLFSIVNAFLDECKFYARSNFYLYSFHIEPLVDWISREKERIVFCDFFFFFWNIIFVLPS